MNMSAWHYEPVKSFHDIDYFYRIRCGLKIRKRVLLSQITGTLYTEYTEKLVAPGVAGRKSWLEMLHTLERARPELQGMQELYISYYDPDKEHDALSLNQYGADYLINGGNNRLCTWKFAGKESILVEVQEYAFDGELFAAWKELKTQRIDIVKLDNDELEPAGKWELHLGCLRVECMGRELVLAFARTYAALREQGFAWLWLRLTYNWRLTLKEGYILPWQAETESSRAYQLIYRSYLLAYKMQQQLLR